MRSTTASAELYNKAHERRAPQSAVRGPTDSKLLCGCSRVSLHPHLLHFISPRNKLDKLRRSSNDGGVLCMPREISTGITDPFINSLT